MGFFSNPYDLAKGKIEELDLEPYAAKAMELFGLAHEYRDQAVREYRHFLYLLFANRKKGHRVPVVPTKQADKIWHAHLLYNGEYNPFCLDLYGEIIIHRPGLEEGSDEFIVAVLHTKTLHDQVGKGGFDRGYFSFVEQSSKKDARKRDEDGGGHGGPGMGNQKHADGDADGGSDDGASCSGGCSG